MSTVPSPTAIRLEILKALIIAGHVKPGDPVTDDTRDALDRLEALTERRGYASQEEAGAAGPSSHPRRAWRAS